ncbi:hypothetical protein [Blastococcus brunescens]|uniref:Uncharacterized protein n=1 Tax=Blastococcus brunescens TaxID=1564165 RepID=A0ABZ1B4Y7_9ACTN|nr:hypothetical protein [Blastococcus sp. BMG 8361]WRL64898.1 hypothetical protein U6N30_03945 [Blastococcus sp. BMG 8361]
MRAWPLSPVTVGMLAGVIGLDGLAKVYRDRVAVDDLTGRWATSPSRPARGCTS